MTQAPLIQMDVDYFESRLDDFLKSATPADLMEATTRAARYLETVSENTRQPDMNYVNNATSLICRSMLTATAALNRIQE